MEQQRDLEQEAERGEENDEAEVDWDDPAVGEAQTAPGWEEADAGQEVVEELAREAGAEYSWHPGQR